MEKIMRNYRTLVLIVLGLVVLAGINIMLFTGALQGFPAPVDSAMKSDEVIQVSYNFNKLIIEPKAEPRSGLIMYGEGKEDVRMYAPISRMLAEGGVKVVFLGRRLTQERPDSEEFDRILAVIQENPTLEWYIGGHTRGAQLPAKYVIMHQDQFAGIVLWAARLGETSSLNGVDLPVVYIYGTLDDANVNLLASNTDFIPSHTKRVSIEGANRADFSYWGPMAADVGSTIPIPEIQKQAAEATLAFMFP
jgi:hypothetical protein